MNLGIMGGSGGCQGSWVMGGDRAAVNGGCKGLREDG